MLKNITAILPARFISEHALIAAPLELTTEDYQTSRKTAVSTH